MDTDLHIVTWHWILKGFYAHLQMTVHNIPIYIYFTVRFESGKVMLEWVFDILAFCWSPSPSVSAISVADISDNVSHF